MDYVIEKIVADQAAKTITRAKEEDRAHKIEVTCVKKARSVFDDIRRGQKLISILCPRGAGKSYTLASLCTWYGEMFPGSRWLVVGSSLKSAKQDYWTGAPGGFQALSAKFHLELDFSYTDIRVTHQNGSIGSLAGVDSKEDMERLRGSKVEADIVVLDECQLHSPDRLRELVDEVLLPGLARRNGVLIVAGTPGLAPYGDFYEATDEMARNADGGITCIPYSLKDTPSYQNISNKEDFWSLHHWTQQDNTALPHLWSRSLANMRRKGWTFDHPIVQREVLGKWVHGASGLVYSYAGLREKGLVNWTPQTSNGNRHGLPVESEPWHMLLGVDFGYEDDFALVVGAYSEYDGTLRHVWDWKSPHLTFDDMVEAIESAETNFGPFDSIVADSGGLGKVLIESLMSRGIPIIRAEKREKFDFIELMNGEYHSGKIKIIDGSDLHHELCALQLDLSRETKEIQARKGRLKEDPNCPNNLADAWLYLWRYSYHRFSKQQDVRLRPGTPEWYDQKAKEEKERYVARSKANTYSAHNDRLIKHTKSDHSVTLADLEISQLAKKSRNRGRFGH